MVTPPSMVSQVGGRVKTDRRDSRKLATMLVPFQLILPNNVQVKLLLE